MAGFNLITEERLTMICYKLRRVCVPPPMQIGNYPISQSFGNGVFRLILASCLN
jgi:hypothetical protein